MLKRYAGCTSINPRFYRLTRTQRFLLAEMIRLSPLNVSILVDFVKSHGIQPDWLHMQVPSGK